MNLKGKGKRRLCGLLCAGMIFSSLWGVCGAQGASAVSETEKVEVLPVAISAFRVDKKEYPVCPSLYEKVLRAFTGGGKQSYVAQVQNYAARPPETPVSVTLHPLEITSAPTPAVTSAPAATATPTATPTRTGKTAANIVLEDDSDLQDDGSVHQDFAKEQYTDGLCIGTVTGKGVYLRKTPSSDGKKLDNLAKGTKVLVFSLKNGWYQVTYRGTSGYMSASYVKSEESGTGKLGYGLVTGSVVHVRKAPGVASASLGKLAEKTVVSILGVSNGWYQIRSGSLEGYMHADYVSSCSDSQADKLRKKQETSGKSSSEGASGSPGENAPSGKASSKVRQILDIAADQLGIPYVWGGNTRSGFDCSGFVQYVFRQAGYSDFPRTHQYTAGTKVSFKELIPGDLVFFSNNGAGVGHVGIYVGNGNFIHSPRPGKKVSYSTLSSGYYYNHFLYGARIIDD